MAAGSYDYSFEYKLPYEMPTSFEGKYGHIRYAACVVLGIPMWSDEEFEEPFTFIQTIDLNVNAALRVSKKKNIFHFLV